MSIIKSLLRTFNKKIVLTGKEAVKPFECDGLSVYRQMPLAVVLVENTKQIKQVISICKKYNTPLITRGAGTGLSGGAIPIENSVVLGLSKLNKILKIDKINQTAIVEPGVANITISNAVAEFNLYYAPDPSSQIACSIGGNVAENSGGVHCLKYGLTVNNVEAIKYINSDLEEIKLTKNDDGLDILALLNGSEGLLGIISEVTVKLLLKPEVTKVIMAGFNSITKCANAITNIIQQGILPAGLEMMDEFAITAVEDFAKVGYPKDSKALLLCELDGTSLQVKLELNKVLNILKPYADNIVVSNNEQQRINLWSGRKSAFPAMGRLSPDYYCMDGTISRAKLAFVLNKILAMSKKYNLRVANVFHAGDGNLHPLILYDANNNELEKAEQFGADILKLCVDVGGSITGEHGVGIEKLDSMCLQFNDKELTIFHKLKEVFDGANILNPTKAIPTLRRCAELGRMHVHNNKVAFADIDRF